MNSAVTPSASDPRSDIIGKLAKLSLLEAALKQSLAPYETQIAALQKACTDATVEEVREIERLRDDIKAQALAHAEELFSDAKSIRVNLLSVGCRNSDKVETVGAEDEVISALEKLSQSPDKSQSLAANACLRSTKELNKVFIRDNFEANQEWFLAMGINLKESVSVSISELKPAKPKAAKTKVAAPAEEVPA